jgi:hypothetical protein
MFKVDGVKIYLLPVSYEGTYTFGALMIPETGEQRGQYRRIRLLWGCKKLRKVVENSYKKPPSIRADVAGPTPTNENRIAGAGSTSGPVDETKCVEIRVDEDGTKRYIIDLV